MATETRTTQGAPPPGGVSFSLSDPTFRAIVYQILVVGAVVLVGWFLISNTLDNLARRSIATGYDFLEREAAFGIGEHVIDYSPKDSYGRAFLVGVLNTLKVAVVDLLDETSTAVKVAGACNAVKRLPDGRRDRGPARCGLSRGNAPKACLGRSRRVLHCRKSYRIGPHRWAGTRR